MIHIWAGVFVFLGIVFSRSLIVENRTKIAFYRTLSGAILNIAFNYILIPQYGINGAAISTLLAQFFANYVFDIFIIDLHHHLKLKTMSLFSLHLSKKIQIK